MKTVQQYSARDRAGCVEVRRNQQTGLEVGVYHAEQADLDPAGGRWYSVCEEHGVLCSHRNLNLARFHAGAPWGWCEDCRQVLRDLYGDDLPAAWWETQGV